MKKNILDRLNAINPDKVVLKNVSKVTSNDYPVGTMSDTLKSAYGLWMQLDGVAQKLRKSIDEQIRQKLADHVAAHIARKSGADCCATFATEMEAIVQPMKTADAEAEAARQIFWNSARLEFPELLGKSTIAFRAGFTLVWTTEEDKAPLLPPDLEQAMQELKRALHL